LVLCNIHAERLLKARPEDSPGKRRAIELNNFLLSAAISSFRLEQSTALGRELTLVDPIEGAELLFEVICRPATNLRNGAPGVVSILKDVTDLRGAMEELRKSLDELQRANDEARHERDRLNLILENVADPIVVTGSKGGIILMNEPAERLLQASKWPAAEIAATTYVANEAKLSSFLSQLSLEAAAARRGEVQLVDPRSAEPLMMSVTASEIRDELGHVGAVVSVLHDLTEIHELERRRVEQELFESQKLAAVGRLAAAFAHEINNPLEAIKNSLYLLLTRMPDSDPSRKFLEIANKETERVSGIVRQMLGFYRPAVVMAPVDIHAVLEETIGLLQRQFGQQQIVVQQDLQRRLPPVLGSADQLKQVFLNLFLNAIEAMPGGGTLRITTRMARGTDSEFVLEGRYVLIQVQDSGTGIDEDDLRHIFEPFFSTKQKQRGSGLGLWVSLGIVQQHGGQMKARSRPGRGTTFAIALPEGGHDA
jgi:PAS domain S-box-containing protein